VNRALAREVVRGEHLLRLEEGSKSGPQGGAVPGSLCARGRGSTTGARRHVDKLVGQQQLVVKSLETNLHSAPGVAGATIPATGA
jgi:hypothetical protein